jgi:hypothetical protein
VLSGVASKEVESGYASSRSGGGSCDGLRLAPQPGIGKMGGS